MLLNYSTMQRHSLSGREDTCAQLWDVCVGPYGWDDKDDDDNNIFLEKLKYNKIIRKGKISNESRISVGRPPA